METLRGMLAALFSWLGTRPNKWLLGAGLAFLGLIGGGICGLSGLLLLTRMVPEAAGHAPSATPQPVAALSPAATRTPPPSPTLELTGTPSPAPGDGYYALRPYPGPPGRLAGVTLPAAVTDPQALAEAESLYEEALVAYGQQAPDAAAAKCDEVLQLNPRHAAAYNLRGASYQLLAAPGTSLADYLRLCDLAAADYARAIVADPQWRPPHTNLGQVYGLRASAEPIAANRARWRQLAIDEHLQATRLDPSQEGAWRGLAQAYVDAGQGELALEALGHVTWTAEVGMITSQAYRCQGALDDALEQSQAGVQADPGDYWQFAERGRVYLARGEYEQALADFERVAELYDGDTLPGWVWYERAAAEYALGHYDRALEYIQTGRGHAWSDWGRPYYYLGMVYLQQGDTVAALPALEWAEQTLDEFDPLLAETRAELEKLRQPTPTPTATEEAG